MKRILVVVALLITVFSFSSCYPSSVGVRTGPGYYARPYAPYSGYRSPYYGYGFRYNVRPHYYGGFRHNYGGHGYGHRRW